MESITRPPRAPRPYCRNFDEERAGRGASHYSAPPHIRYSTMDTLALNRDSHGPGRRSTAALAAKTPTSTCCRSWLRSTTSSSVSRAARQLGMSQPAVSKALRRLREAFDDPLFVRGPSGIVPTPRAHAIVRAARPHLLQSAGGSAQRRALRSGDEHAADRAGTVRRRGDGLPAVDPRALRARAPKCPVSTVTLPDAQLARAGEGRCGCRGGLLSGTRPEKLPSAASLEARVRVPDARGASAVEDTIDVSAFMAAEHWSSARGPEPGSARAVPRPRASPPERLRSTPPAC